MRGEEPTPPRAPSTTQPHMSQNLRPHPSFFMGLLQCRSGSALCLNPVYLVLTGKIHRGGLQSVAWSQEALKKTKSLG